MRRLLWVSLFVILIFRTPAVLAQGTTSVTRGDPPIAALISISAPNENGIVTITGATGAVFPGAQVAVRNLYTEETVYVTAGITGAFTASLYGPGNTPFQISPAILIPTERRDQPGALPGGPATIIYGAFPEVRTPPTIPITQLIVDGVLSDWDTYDTAALSSGFALRNQNSIYLGIPNPLVEAASIRVQLNANDIPYNISLNPMTHEIATWQELGDVERDLGTIGAVVSLAEALEIRLPLEPFRARQLVEDITITLSEIAYLDADNNVLDSVFFTDASVIPVEEQDGIVYAEDKLNSNITRFSISGAVAQGASTWHARVRLNSLTYQLGDDLIMQMDVRLNAPDLPDTLTNLSMIGQFGLLPVTDSEGNPISGGLNTSNGWSTVTTAGGLAIENIHVNLLLGEVVIPPPQIIRQGDDLVFGFDVALPIPEGIPAGTYVPYFEGYAQAGDGDRFRWSENGVFGAGDGLSRNVTTRFPVVFNIGTSTDADKRLLWTLFQDTPSNGSRGLIANEDKDLASLANRVKFNAPTYILPPSTRYNDETVTYLIEPYLVNLLPNDYASSSAPLLPLLFPNGRLTATITLPDGTEDNLSSTPILQNALSTFAENESTLFGQHSQVDTYHITTLNDLYTDQVFDQYGNYTIELSGFVEDVWGNRYEGGGTYEFLVAEAMDISPATLPGTPFEVGNALNAGVHVFPSVAADVTITVQVYPLDGSDMIEQTFEGQANPYGVFQPEEAFVFETAGEYIVDYEVRYTDAEGRLWAGSLRSAGVIGTAQDEIVLRGQRGVANPQQETVPAWYSVENLSGLASETTILNAPYSAGDIAWLQDAATTGISLSLNLQDLIGNYAAWLQKTYPNFTSATGTTLERLIATDSLPNVMLAESPAANNIIPFLPEPIANEGYAYVSFMQPHISLRQFVTGSEQSEVPLVWSPSDPGNQQIGAGFAGLRPDDFGFLFGGSILRNDAAQIQQSAIYGAFAVIIDEDDERGARVYPPYQGAASGPNGGALFTVGGEPIGMFFHPTGTRPGDVLEVGDILAVSGQVAPTLASDVSVTITSPSGDVREFGGTANAIGYYYDAANHFMVDEIGVWTVQIQTQHTGRSSAGNVEPPFPSGGVLGTQNGTFNVYVVADNTDKLAWTQIADQDLSIPAGFPFNINLIPPQGWTSVVPYITAQFPSQVVQDGFVPLPGSNLTYQYNPTALSRQYSFFEGNEGRVSGAASSDPFMLTFVFIGLNEQGEVDIVARQVVIRHDRLITLD